ncbi:MAG: ROK family protein [Dehalococcoidia bacterium]|nr:MAG: ROK family protein [Dehalococcoidia bacterium]
MSKRKWLVLALDVGGTHFRIALINEKGETLKQYKGASKADKGPDKAIGSIIQSISEMLSDVDSASVIGMGIAVAGLVTPQTGVLLTSPNMQSWYNTPLKDIFERELQMPVSVGNDANLAVLGEHRFGAGVGSDHVIYITVSTGIGGGVISGGKLITGSRGFAGELGHMTIDLNGPKCNCGSIGCLEVMASGTAIARIASDRLSHGEASTITSLVDGDLSKVTAKVVVEAARTGDELAGEVMHTAASNLGVGLANYVHIFNPDIIALGGGVSQAGELLFEPVRSVVAERIMPDYEVSIVPAALGDDSGLLGAAALVLGDYL